jgi:type IX secretion system PorP/SprF family membrane protein
LIIIVPKNNSLSTNFKKIRIIGTSNRRASYKTTMLKSSLLLQIFLLTLLILGFKSPVKAQDPEFTQFYANPLYLNPAFAGTARCPRVVLNYRNQWPALAGTFVTTSASYDQHIDAISGGLGFQIYNDKAGKGTLQTTNISAIYSYQRPISRTISLKAGFQATYFQRSLDWNKLTFGDQIDPKKGFIFKTNDIPRGGVVNNVDFSTGVLVFTEKFYGGFAAHHLAEPNESLITEESRLPRKFTAHAGAVFSIDGLREGLSEVKLSPNILYQQQGDFSQLNFGLYVQKGPLVGGIWYRANQQLIPDSFIALIGVQTNTVKIGYSYDLTVSRLTTKSGGSHEISFAMQFGCKPIKKKFRTISCPSF